MGWFGQTWFDRIRGRGRAPEAGPEAQRAGARREEDELRRPPGAAEIEEGATAARDENLARHEPFHPPGG